MNQPTIHSHCIIFVLAQTCSPRDENPAHPATSHPRIWREILLPGCYPEESPGKLDSSLLPAHSQRKKWRNISGDPPSPNPASTVNLRKSYPSYPS